MSKNFFKESERSVQCWGESWLWCSNSNPCEFTNHTWWLTTWDCSAKDLSIWLSSSKDDCDYNEKRVPTVWGLCEGRAWKSCVLVQTWNRYEKTLSETYVDRPNRIRVLWTFYHATCFWQTSSLIALKHLPPYSLSKIRITELSTFLHLILIDKLNIGL